MCVRASGGGTASLSVVAEGGGAHRRGGRRVGRREGGVRAGALQVACMFSQAQEQAENKEGEAMWEV